MKYIITLFIVFLSEVGFSQIYNYELVDKDISIIELPDSDFDIIKSYDLDKNSHIAIIKTKDSNGFPLYSAIQIDKKDLSIKFKSKAYFSDNHVFLSFFEINKVSSPVIVILRIDHEWYSDLYAFITEDETLKDIGFLDVTLDPTVKYPSKDHLGYPIEEISIKTIDNQIIFSFNKDLIYNKKDENLKVKHNDFRYIYTGEKLMKDIKK